MQTPELPELPFNLFPPPDDPHEVPRLRHVRGYLDWCRERCDAPLSGLMERVGYRKRQKFLRHRDAWHAAERPVPLAYLEALGVDMAILVTALRFDQKELDARLDGLPLPKEFGVRYLPAVYGSVPLPDVTGEDDAIDYVKAYAKETGRRCCIAFPGSVKTIFVEPSGSHRCVVWRPSMSVANGRVDFGDRGDSIGRSRVR